MHHNGILSPWGSALFQSQYLIIPGNLFFPLLQCTITLVNGFKSLWCGLGVRFMVYKLHGIHMAALQSQHSKESGSEGRDRLTSRNRLKHWESSLWQLKLAFCTSDPKYFLLYKSSNLSRQLIYVISREPVMNYSSLHIKTLWLLCCHCGLW